MAEQLKEAHKFRIWEKKISDNGLSVNYIDELYSRRKPNGEILFSLLYTDAITPEGNKIPPICFLKGEVVCVLVCLVDEVSRNKYMLLVRQRRICDGSLTYEHPAGMLDSESDPAVVALREVHEETGLEIKKDDLVCVSPEPLFPSTGTSDEAIYLFYCEVTVPYETILSMHGKNTGEISDNEHITTHIIPFAEGHRLISNTNNLLLNFLYLKDVEDWELLKSL